MQLIVSAYLPTQETRKASCIETRKEVEILTGEKRNAIRAGEYLYVSQEVYDNFLKL